MLLFSLVVSLVVAAPQTDDAPTSTSPLDAERVQAPSEAVNFDTLPDASPSDARLADDKRVQRFLGALAGGLVGFGAAAAFISLTGDPTCFGCATAGQLIAGSLTPVVGVLGAWLGSTLMGGQAGPLTGFMGVVPALALVLCVVAISAGLPVTNVGQQVPFIAIAGAFLAGGSALALDVREQQLASLGRASSWGAASAGRVTVTALTSTIGAGLAGLLSVLLGVLNPVAGIIGGMAQGFGVAAATWGVHKAMGGRGTFTSVLAALGIGGALTAGAVALMTLASSSTFNPLRTTSGATMAAQLGVISAAILPALALEWSHTDVVAARLPRLSIGAAPTAQGGMVAAGLRF